MEPAALHYPEPLDSEEQVNAWGIESGDADFKFKAIKINRPKVAPKQVKFEMLYCGVCHSDVHIGKGDLGQVQYPFVGGHELLGRVTEIGEGVTRVKVGDVVAVGCFVEACLECNQCKIGDEQYCDKGMTGTYNGQKKHGMALGNQETRTHGGYSESHTVHEHFIIKIPDGMDLAKTGPIMCAGITLYDPLRHWGFTKCTGKTVGIIGIGGLGTMGIKLAKAMGHKVVAISSSSKKADLAKEKGADVFVAMSDEESVKAAANTCDLILNTVSAEHDLNVYLPLVAKNGVLCQLGLVTKPHQVSQLPLMFARKSVAGSLIGGIAATQECVDFCAKHGIYPDCQTITADKLAETWKELDTGANANGLRYVLDIKASLAALN